MWISNDGQYVMLHVQNEDIMMTEPLVSNEHRTSKSEQVQIPERLWSLWVKVKLCMCVEIW